MAIALDAGQDIVGGAAATNEAVSVWQGSPHVIMTIASSGNSTNSAMSHMGQTRHFGRALLTSSLAQGADIFRVRRHVSKVPIATLDAWFEMKEAAN